MRRQNPYFKVVIVWNPGCRHLFFAYKFKLPPPHVPPHLHKYPSKTHDSDESPQVGRCFKCNSKERWLDFNRQLDGRPARIGCLMTASKTWQNGPLPRWLSKFCTRGMRAIKKAIQKQSSGQMMLHCTSKHSGPLFHS